MKTETPKALKTLAHERNILLQKFLRAQDSKSDTSNLLSKITAIQEELKIARGW